MQTTTAQRILAGAAMIVPKSGVRNLSTLTANAVKSRPNTFFKAEQAVMAPRNPKSSIDMTAADRQYANTMPKPMPMQPQQHKSRMAIMTSTSTSTATAMPMTAPTKKSEVFKTQRPGFYGVSAIVRDFSTASAAAAAKPAPAASSSASTTSKIMQTTRPGFYGLSAFRSFSTATRNKEFYVGINADWPAQPAPPEPATTSRASVKKAGANPKDNIDLPEEHPTWRPVDDGKVLSESEARIPQNESENYISALP